MNTTYTSRLKPQFQNAGVQNVGVDLSGVKAGLDTIIKQNQNQLTALRNIAQDQAQIEFNRGSAELIKQYGTDYAGLDKALLGLENELYGKIKPTHPDMAEDLLRQNDLVRARAVEQARRDYDTLKNNQIKEGTSLLLDGYKMALPDDYADYLDTMRKPAEEKNMEIIGRWQNNLSQIDQLINRRDLNGNYIYDKKTRSEKQFLQEYMLDGAKNMIDRFVTANDKAGLQDYYQAQLLAPERYMKESGQDRTTYDKVKKYAEDQLKRMDVEAKDLKFKQSVADATGLIVKYSDAKMKDLRESKVLPDRVLDKLESANVKFDERNAAEPELATNIFNVMSLINRWEAQPNAQTTEEQVQGLFEASMALDELADYALAYPMTEKDLELARQAILSKASNQAFGELFKNFGEITEGFAPQIKNVEESVNKVSAGKDPWYSTKINAGWWNINERDKAVAQISLLADALRSTWNESLIATQNGNLEELPKIARKFQVAAARIRYNNNFTESDWDSWAADKDHIFEDRVGHGLYRVKEITPSGRVITEIVK